MDEVKMDDMLDRASGAPQHRTGPLQVFRRMKHATTPLQMHLGPHKLEQNKLARLAEQKQLAVKKASLKFVGHPQPSQGSATGSATSVLSSSVRAAHTYSDEPGCPTKLAEANKQPPQALKVFRKATAKSPKPLVKQQPNRPLKKVQSPPPPRPLQHAKLDGTVACAVSEPAAAETAPAWASTLGAGAAVAAAAAAPATSRAQVPPLERSFSEPPSGLEQLLAAVAADEAAAARLIPDEPLHQQLKAAEESSAATRQHHRNMAAGCQMTCHTLLSQQQPSDVHCQHQQCHPQALQDAVQSDQGASALVSLLQTLCQDASSRQPPPASGLLPLQQSHRHQPQQPLLRQQDSTLAQLTNALRDESQQQQQQQISNTCLHLQQVHKTDWLSAPADLAAENATTTADATPASPFLVRDGSLDSEQSHGAATAPLAQAVAGSFTAESGGAASLEIVASVIRLLLQLTAMQVSPEAADHLREGLTKAMTAAAAAVMASGQSFDLAAELNALVPTLQRAVVETWVARQTQEAVAAATAVVSLLSPPQPHAAATMAIAAAAGAAAGAAAAAGSHQPLPDVNAIFGSFVSGIEAVAEAGPACTKPAEESYAAAAAAATGKAPTQPSAEQAALLLAAGGSASVTAARLTSWPHAGDDAGTSAAAAADMEIDVAKCQEQQQQQHSVRLLRLAGRQVQHATQRSNNSSCCLST